MKLFTFFSCAFFFLVSIKAENPSTLSHHLQEISQEYCSVANHLEQTGNKTKAKELYKKAISLSNDNAFAKAKLGCMYYEENNVPEAITYLTQSLALQPDDAHIHFNLGQCYIKQQEWSAAINEFQKIVAYEPKNERAHLQLGLACEKLNHYEDAINAYKKAVEIAPNFFDAHHSLGNIFKHLEKLEDAVEYYRQAHKLQPLNPHVMMDLANTLNMLNNNQESLELYEKILEKNPNALSALYNFGFTLKKMGHLERALEVYQQVLAKKLDYAPVHFSLSSIYLTLGDFDHGWQEYEWRWKAYNEEPRKFSKPMWQGEDIVGRTLFVYAEQGLGDTLQFIRYLKFLKSQSKHIHIIFESQEPLIPLLKQQPYIDQVISRHEKPVYFHYQIPLMSLPYVLKTRLGTIPADIPYIEPAPDLVEQWKEKLSADKNFKIGLCWQGNARYSTQSLRRAVALKSIELKQFAPLFEIPGVSIYSLQKIDGIEQIEACPFKDKLITFDATFDQTHGRFMDTAAVMKNFDLIISVDTGTCHLAGGMGVATWILLPCPADWRWLLDRTDSPWYPSIRLFRQQKPGEWEPVITAIAQEITRLIANKTSAVKKQSDTLFSQKPSNDQLLFFEQLINSLE